MKTLKKLYHHLSTSSEFRERYPNYDKKDKKIHILFLSACTNETGYYRMILPALELNRTLTHSAIIAHLHKWDFNKQFDDYDTPIDFRLIQWADYIVMSALFSDVNYIIQSIREINSDVEFVMDLDVNYHALPEDHPDFKKFSQELKQRLLTNLGQIDLISAPNQFILNNYLRLAQQQEEEVSVYFERYGNLLSHFTYEDIKHIERNTKDTVRIGIILDQGNDVKTIESPLTTLKEKFKDKIEFILFGWSQKMAEHFGLFKNVQVTYEKPVPFQEYHNRLNNLALDIGLLPFVNNAYNISGKGLIRYLDFSGYMVPVVASKMLPFEKLIAEGETGFLAAIETEWLSKIELLIENSTLRREIGEHAFKMAWEDHSYTPRSIERLKNIFI